MNKNKLEKFLSKTTKDIWHLIKLAKELTFPKNQVKSEAFPEIELIEKIESSEHSNTKDAV